MSDTDDLRHQSGKKSEGGYDAWIDTPRGLMALTIASRCDGYTQADKLLREAFEEGQRHQVRNEAEELRPGIEWAVRFLRENGLEKSALALEHRNLEFVACKKQEAGAPGLVRALAYEEMVKAFEKWAEDRPAGGALTPFDAFAAGARWWHAIGRES